MTASDGDDAAATERALDELSAAAHSERQNVYASVVAAAQAAATHGEIVACLRDAFGTGDPLIVP